MAKWEGSCIWVIAWSLLAMVFSIEPYIGMPLVIALVVLLIALAGALESAPETRAVRFAIWGAAAFLGVKVATLGGDLNRPLWILFGVGLIGAIGELFGSLPFRPRRLLHAAAGGIGFGVGGYLMIVLGMVLASRVKSLIEWTALADFELVVAFGLAGLGGGLAAETIRSIPRPARACHEPDRTMEA
ncbi:MAG TPA: hypothetical protein VM557_11430 [Thermoanaerobaculia bacterium]|nr:hypothetical protein [Thermoanaerobaculia bacterium]